MESNYCEFDSTWEDEHYDETPRRQMYSRRNMYAAKDMQEFRHRIRILEKSGDDEPDQDRFYNLEFHHGRIKSSPDSITSRSFDNVHIKEFHQYWRGDYQRLEDVHSYVQWLFPIQEQGVNMRSHVLTKREIKLFRQDDVAKRNLVRSYKLMLDFYGIRLTDERTGTVARADNWRERFSNLNRHSHNNLRITRILKCLGTLGLKHYQAPLVQFFLDETLVKGNLQSVKQSVLDYFIFAVLDKLDRKRLVKYAFEHFRPREQFVWGPRKILSGSQEVQGKNETEKKSQSHVHTLLNTAVALINPKHERKEKEGPYSRTERSSRSPPSQNQEHYITSYGMAFNRK